MIDVIQLIVLLVIIVVTLVFVILGIQVYYILREMRKTIMKANKVLDTTNYLTESVSAPLSALSSIMSGLTAGSVVSNLIKIALRVVSGDKKKSKGDDNGE